MYDPECEAEVWIANAEYDSLFPSIQELIEAEPYIEDYFSGKPTPNRIKDTLEYIDSVVSQWDNYDYKSTTQSYTFTIYLHEVIKCLIKQLINLNKLE